MKTNSIFFTRLLINVIKNSLGAVKYALLLLFLLCAANFANAQCDPQTHPAPQVTISGSPQFICVGTPTVSYQDTVFLPGNGIDSSINTVMNTISIPASEGYADTSGGHYVDGMYVQTVTVTLTGNPGSFQLTDTAYFIYSDGCVVKNFFSLPVTVLELQGRHAYPPILCAGGTTTLTETALGAVGGKYTFSLTPGGATSIINPAIFSGVTANTYTVNMSVTVSNTTCFATDTIHILDGLPYPTPSITETDQSGVANNDKIICNGDCADLSTGSFTTYSWSNGSTISSAHVCPSSNTAYNVTVTNVNGCAGTATVTITVNSLPNPSITETDNSGVAPNDRIICAGATAGLNVGTFGSYSWSTGATTSAITVTPASTTTYTVTVTNAGCSATATTTVTVNPVPVPSITETDNSGVAPNDGIICAGATAGLDVGEYTTYSWSTGTTGIHIITVNPSSTTTYTVTVTNAGCSATATTTVTVNPVPVPSITETDNSGVAPNDGIICAGATAGLNVGTFGSYSWSTGATTSAITVTPASTTTYTVTVTNAGCSATATTTVTVNPVPVPSITETDNSGVAPNDGIICAGATAGLNVGTFGSYSWSTGATTSAITVTPASTTTYTVTVTNAGCSATATTTVTVNPVPVPSITETDNSGVAPNDGIICAGATAGLNVGTFGSYSWSTGATTSAITVTPASTTTYTVTVTNAGCSATATTTVTVNPVPVPSITETDNSGVAPNDGIICAGATAGLNVGTFGSYSWSTGATTSAITVTPASTTTYTVTVTNAGCSATATTTVTVNPVPVPSITETDNSGVAPNDGIICAGATAGLNVGTFGSYSWSTGATTSAITVTPASTTTYTVTVTNAGCSATATTTVTVNPVPVPSITETDNSGVAPNDGIICAGATAGLNVGTFGSYSWSTGATTSAITVTPASTTTYTVTVTNAGCSATATTTVTVNPVPVPSITETDNSGVAPNDGIICAGATAGLDVGEYTTYSWSTGTTGIHIITVNPSSTTTYTVTVTNAGCSATATTTVTVNPVPVPSITETDNSGVAPNDGIICAGATAGLNVGTFGSYSWSTGATTSAITVTPASTTTYTVTVTNAGCSATATTTVTVNPVPVPSITETDNSGVAPNDGIICAGATAGLNVGIFGSYSWSTGATTSAITVTPASTTTYTVTVTNAGCSATATTTVTVNPVPVPSITETDNSGVAPNDGIICAGATAGLNVGTFGSYSWSTGATTSAITVTPASTTTYTVTVTNAGCSATATTTVTVNPVPVPSITETDNSGVAPNDGIICAGATAGLNVGTFGSYSWSTGATTSAITVTPASTTTYTVTVTNAGCSATATTTVTVNPVPVPSITETDNSGVAPNDGIICAGATAGLNVGTFGSYSWSTGATTSAITVTPASTTTYTVTVTNAGCSATATTTVTVNPVPVPSITETDNSGVAPNDGIICAGATAGLNVGTFGSYSWSTGATTSAITVTPASTTTYTVTVTNAGCSATATTTVTVNPVPVPSITETDNSGVAPNDGIICAGATAGLNVGTFGSYSWSTGATTSAITVTPASTTTYTVTVTNAGCSATATTTVTVNPVPVPSITETDNSGVAPNDGIICAGATAGLNVGTFGSYSWSTGATTSAITVTPASTTTYTVTVTNAGCSATATTTVTVNPVPVPSITETDNSGVAPNDGIICAGATAGLNVGTFGSYSWSTGATTSAITVTPASTTTYTVTVTNAGCSATATTTVTVNPVPVPSITETDNSGVAPNDGIICAGATAGLDVGEYTTYSWSTGTTGIHIITVNPSSTTTYTVTVSNAGCSATATTTVTVNPVPVPSITETDNSGVAPNDGIICAGATAGLNVGTFGSYSWSTGATTSAITVTPASTTTYTVTVTNAGCSATATTTVTVNPVPVPSITETDNSGVAPNDGIICAGATAGLNVGTFGSYSWSTGATTSAITVTPASTTTYTVTVTNAGCSATATTTVTVNPVPVPSITETDNSGVAPNDGIICAGATAGLNVGTFGSYSWSTGATTSAITVTPASTTTYTVTVTNAGCSATATTTVTVNPVPVPSITETDNSGVAPNDGIICAGATAGLNVGTFGSYSWSTGATTSAITVTPASTTTYTVTVTNAGCSATATTTVTVNPVPVPSITETDNSGVAPNDGIICAGATAGLNVGTFGSYSWSTGATTSAITVTPASTTTYTVTVTNAGCSATATTTVTVNPVPVPSITETDNSGVAPNDGIICAGATAGLNVGTFGSYSWSTGATTSAITVTPASTTTYTVTVTNAGCSATATTTVTVNPVPVPSITETDNSGVAPNDGIICAGATAGLNVGTFGSYSWSTGATTSAITVTPASTTTYTVTVTNAGCSATATTTVTVNPVPVPSITETDNSGVAPNDGIICAGATAGLDVGEYTTYSWSTGTTGIHIITVNPSSTTTYTVTVSNAGCSATATTTVTVNPVPVPSITETDNSGVAPNDGIICAGATAGLNVGTFGSYSWSTGATTSAITVTPASTTTYTVTVTNAGCSATATTTVTVNPVPVPSITETDNSGVAPNDGIICAGATAGLNVGTFGSYSWSTGATTSAITVTPASTTTYIVTVTNAGCSATATKTITVNQNPGVTVTPTDGTCRTQGLGTACANASGGSGSNYTYMWNTGSTLICINVPAGSYSVMVTDGNACKSSNPGTGTVNVNTTPPPVSCIAPTPLSCSNPCTQLQVNGCTGTGFNYLWSGPSGYSSNSQCPPCVQDSGTYTVTVTDPVNGCTNTCSEIVTGAASGYPLTGKCSDNGPVYPSDYFQLTGNPNSNPLLKGDDWDVIYKGTSTTAQAISVGAPGWGGIVQDWPSGPNTDNEFVEGTKDINDISDWSWSTHQVPDKDDLLHAGAALYGGHYLYFFSDRYATNGDAQMGLWLFQSGVAPLGTTKGGFSGQHQVGDLLILSDFTNGGGVATLFAYEWVGTGGNTGGTLNSLSLNSVDAYARVNTASVPSPWPYTPKFGPKNLFSPGAFFEGGIDLECVVGNLAGYDLCTFLFETRASQEATAELKDFIFGSVTHNSNGHRMAEQPDNTKGNGNIILRAYPNPFSNITTIEVLPNIDYNNATLDLYDVNGQKVSSLFAGPVVANQTYHFDINGVNLSPGIYIYSFKAGDDAIFGKVILIK